MRFSMTSYHWQSGDRVGTSACVKSRPLTSSFHLAFLNGLSLMFAGFRNRAIVAHPSLSRQKRRARRIRPFQVPAEAFHRNYSNDP